MSGPIDIATRHAALCAITPRWVSWAPFGRPVVPEVYITRQTSSGPALLPSSGCPAARNGSYSSPSPPITTRRGTRLSASAAAATSASCAPWKSITGRESSRM